MVSFEYVSHELRRRWSRTLVTALGLASGVGLVMGIVGVSNGLSAAQNQVLSPLSSVGTDIVVERTVGVADTTQSNSSQASSANGGFFDANRPNAKANEADKNALDDNNSSVITDLAKLGPPGTQFNADFFVTGTLITFPQSAVSDIAKIGGVQAAVPALSLDALHESGTVPTITATFTTGGQTISQTSQPPPLTSAETGAIVACLEKNGILSPADENPSSIDFTSTAGQELTQCLPADYQKFITNVVVPQQTISKVLSPPETNTETTSYTVAGVDPSNPNEGLVTKAQLVSGKWFTTKPTDQILVSSAYASTHKLKVGQALTINKIAYQVVGLVNPTLTGDTSDIYFDLATLQSKSSEDSRVNEVLVKVASASDVDSVASKIRAELPGATVLTSKQLAGQVSGSLSDAKSLASDLGVALGIIILIAALLIAALLTLSSIAKRVREIGTLRAVGWTKGRVMSQILAEMAGIGIIGAVMGVAIGLIVCQLVDTFGPPLAYSTTGVVVGSSSVSDALRGTSGVATSIGTTIGLHASVSIGTVGLAVVMAILGGLIAGMAGAWRAARMSPVSALRDLG